MGIIAEMQHWKIEIQKMQGHMSQMNCKLKKLEAEAKDGAQVSKIGEISFAFLSALTSSTNLFQ